MKHVKTLKRAPSSLRERDVLKGNNVLVWKFHERDPAEISDSRLKEDYVC